LNSGHLLPFFSDGKGKGKIKMEKFKMVKTLKKTKYSLSTFDQHFGGHKSTANQPSG
jgi:hypothetical protein